MWRVVVHITARVRRDTAWQNIAGRYMHEDAIKWINFPRYWLFVRGIHRSPGEFPTQRPVTQSFDVFFDLRLNQRLSKHT